jgi:hypothetical protein
MGTPAARSPGTTPAFSGQQPAPREVHGDPDGPPIVLGNGLVIECRMVNGQRVTQRELFDVLEGLAALPRFDLDFVAKSGVPIRLVPVASLEPLATGQALLGATTVVSGGGDPTRVTMVRVAVRAGRQGHESTREILQHEIGHVVSVLRTGDMSERAAESYAARY